MDVSTIKEQLHDYIEHADEKHLEAIYVLLENEISLTGKYDDATLEMLNKRRENHINGISKSYTMEESLNLIRTAKK